MTRKQVLAVGIAGVLGLAGLEGATRLLFESNTVFNLTIGGFRAYHPTRGTQLKPGYRAGTIAINSLGFLGPEFSMDRRPGSVRLLFIGNSVTFRPPHHNYPRVVEARLQTSLPEVDLEVIVGAVPGYSSREALDWYRQTLGDLDPDITVIYLGWNDMAQYHPFGLRYKNEGVSRDPTLLGRAMMHLHFLRIPYYFLGRIERARPIDQSPLTPEEQAALDGFTPTPYAENLTTIVDRSKAGGSTVFLVSLASVLTHPPTPDDLAIMHFPRGMGRKLALYRAVYDRYRLSLEEVARATGTPIIDLSEVIRDPAIRRDIFTDTMHINEAGAELYGRVLADYLAPIVDSLARDRTRSTRP